MDETQTGTTDQDTATSEFYCAECSVDLGSQEAMDAHVAEKHAETE